jgi:hypothetical protein
MEPFTNVAKNRKIDGDANLFSSGHALRSLGKVGKPGKGKGRAHGQGKTPVQEEQSAKKSGRNDGYR